MTLVLALRAEDGVVLASDSQATSAEGVATRTSTQKLDLLHERIAFGCAGSAGLRQRVRELLADEISVDQCAMPFEELRDSLHAAVNKAQKHAKDAHIPMTMLDEPDGVGVLFAGHSAGRPWIYEVTRKGGDQEHFTGEAIGHVRHYAAYALISAEHYELAKRGLGQVRLLAYRAVDDAIRTDASALGSPVDLVEVTADGARQLTKEETDAVSGAVIAWQEHEREVFDRQPGDLVVEINEHGIDPPSG